MPITDKTGIAAVSEHLPSPERSLISTAFFVIIPRLKISEQFNIYLVMLSLYNTTVIICMHNFKKFYRYSLVIHLLRYKLKEPCITQSPLFTLLQQIFNIATESLCKTRNYVNSRLVYIILPLFI